MSYKIIIIFCGALLALFLFPFSSHAYDYIFPPDTKVIQYDGRAGGYPKTLYTLTTTSTIIGYRISIDDPNIYPNIGEIKISCRNGFIPGGDPVIIRQSISSYEAGVSGAFLEVSDPDFQPTFTVCSPHDPALNATTTIYAEVLTAYGGSTFLWVYFVERDLTLMNTESTLFQYLIFFLDIVLFVFVAYVVMRIFKR